MTALTVATYPTIRRLPIPVAEPRPALRVVPEPEAPPPGGGQGVLTLTGADGTSVADADPAPGRPSPPPAAAWARQFVQAALEVAAGRRPVSQLVRWTDEHVYALLNRRACLATRLDRSGAPAGVCSVRSVRLCRPCPGVVEASAVVTDRGRLRAVALRLEDAGGRWRVTALEIG